MKRRSKVVLYLCLAAAVVAAVLFRWRWERKRQAAEHHRRGVAAFQEGNLERAAEEFQRETALAPTQPAGYYSLGIVEQRRGRYPLAARALRKAIELGATELDAPCALGFVAYRMAEYQAAVSPLRECVTRKPNDDQARYLLTQCYIGQGLSDDAEREVATLIERRPAEGQFHYVLGSLYLQRPASSQNNEAALRSLRKAIAFDKRLVGAYYSLGIVYRRMNRLHDAAQMLEQAVRRDPNNSEARRLLAATYQQLGRTADAQVQFRKVREEMTRVRHSQRLDYLMGEVLRNPQLPIAHFQLGCFYDETNELHRAAAALQTAAQLDPRWAEVHDKLALVYERMSKPQEAEKERETARRLRR